MADRSIGFVGCCFCFYTADQALRNGFIEQDWRLLNGNKDGDMVGKTAR
ncbi:MAG: hypothetical protein Q4D54_04405 [Eubacteriales bacterium]|nr:hypothetical protein [Eubacteriales bacterium]